MGVILFGKSREKTKRPRISDFLVQYNLLVSSDFEIPISFTFFREWEGIYAVAPVIADFEITASLRLFVPGDIHIPYTLDVLKASNEVLSSYSIFVNSDTQSLSSVREYIKNDVESSYLLIQNVDNSIELEYDITTINKVHKDFLSVYMIFDPNPAVINFGFWVKLEGET
ncbi:MAG: hypothetical protein B7C24_16580 [Bacteroidetes bacterium 4572_77]|nr:MAG: hypothetical protein B7C24_16580 [Bacteroidetes bacterium 4572_77]